MTSPLYGAGLYGAGLYGLVTDADLTFTVELDLSGSSFGTAFSATDVSSKAVAGLGFEPMTVTWGRQDQHSDVTPTTVDGALLNTDGTFSPGNTTGTYYPQIRRGLRRRVSVGVNFTSVDLSEDYATSIEVEPARDSPAITKLSGSDILARMGQATSAQDVSALSVGTTLRSFLAEEMLVDNPSCLYMLQEGEGATSFADVTGSYSPLTVANSKYGAGVVDAGQTPSGTFYGGTVVDITNSDYATYVSGNAAKGSWLSGTVPNLSASTAYTVEAFVVTPTVTNGTFAQIVAAAPPSNPASYAPSNYGFAVQGSGKISFYGFTSLFGSVSAVDSAHNLCDGQLHHLVGTVSSGTLSFYVDGVLQGTMANGGSVGPSGGNLLVGMMTEASPLPTPAYPFTGAVAYLAFYPTALSGTRVAVHNQAATSVFVERTDQRIARLLSYRSNTGSSLDTGLGTVGPQDIAGRTLQDCLFEVAQTEGGVVFTDGTGQINFRSRSRLFNPTPTVTLDMKAGGVDFGSNWREDTQNVVNDATVTNSTTGSAQRFYSTSSITADGEYATSTELPLNSDTDALNMAGWLVANGTQSQLTATPLLINLLHLTPAQAQAVLQLRPLDCIQLTNCPIPAPSATETFIVQGGTISLAADAATVTLNLTPLPYPVGVWDSTHWDATGVTWAF